MVKTVLWKDIYEKLRTEIKSGKYKSGDKFLRIKDICKKFNVSEITARRILDELEKERLIKQRQRIGSIIKIRKRNKIYFLISSNLDVKNLSSLHIIQARIFKGIFEKSIEEKVEIEFVSDNIDFENLKKENVYMISYHTLNSDIEEKVLNTKDGSNIILIHSTIPFPNLHTVRIDLYKSAYLATKHLLERNYRKIGFITGRLDDEWFLPRFEGYLSALKEKRIGFDIGLVRVTDGLNKEEDWEAIEELLNLKERPDAIFCANDVRAINVLEYCNRKNIKVPEELAICGFDNIPDTETTLPPLTTVDTKLEQLGEKSIELGIELLEGRIKEIKDIIIEPELIIRQTT
ncbi:MAG: LacI family transcriptional regulator [Candidatus Omnitrophica bacterium]|nr:LacI family transcriptional regulator [Candidatus Omnitrophota bacterium]